MASPSLSPAENFESQNQRALKIRTVMLAPLACDRVRVLEPDQLSNTIPGVTATSTISKSGGNHASRGRTKIT